MIKSMVLCLTAVFAITLFACSKKCNCRDAWDKTFTYGKGSLVTYHDTCWIAKSQGRGIVPGPWLENSNDIWVLCEDK
jgi:hypothetical protein